MGFAAAPLAAALNLRPLLEEARVFVDLALGLVLFDLGRRMDLNWMRRDWTLAAAGLAESLLTFVAVFAVLMAFDYNAVVAGITASIAMATSPAVVLLIVQDAKAEGQVTERALNLVALNSLFASILTTILLTSAHIETKVEVENALLHPAYLFAGSVFLGWLVASVARVIARDGRQDAGPALHADRGHGVRSRGARGAAEALGDPVVARVRPLHAQRRAQLRPPQREPRACRAARSTSCSS